MVGVGQYSYVKTNMFGDSLVELLKEIADLLVLRSSKRLMFWWFTTVDSG